MATCASPSSLCNIGSLTLRSRRLITRILNCYWKNQATICTPTTSHSDWLRDSRSTQWARAEYKRPRPAGWWTVFRGCRWTEAAKWDVWMSLITKNFQKSDFPKIILGMTGHHWISGCHNASEVSSSLFPCFICDSRVKGKNIHNYNQF